MVCYLTIYVVDLFKAQLYRCDLHNHQSYNWLVESEIKGSVRLFFYLEKSFAWILHRTNKRWTCSKSDWKHI